jgi:hypothetical protein
MKFKLLAVLLFTLSISLFSCSKSSNSPTPTNPIVGLWIGTLSADNEPQAGALYYSFDIKADSTILTVSQGADGNTYYGQGTWTLTGSAFKATTTSTSANNLGVVQTITAAYSNNGTLSSGVWKNQNGTATGTFALNRIN